MFEWDDEKNLANIEKHGIDFDTAKRIFEGQTLTIIDDRFDYGEVREISIGMVDGIAILTVAHTDREDKIRIISARRANQKERARYEQEIL
ncbi:MAG: BrnT family toxin [Pseudomonadota bacterium]